MYKKKLAMDSSVDKQDQSLENGNGKRIALILRNNIWPLLFIQTILN